MSNDTQSPGPNPPNHTQVEVHPGWVRSGRDDTPGRKAYYINLEAKPGKGDKVEQFLRDILAGVEQEPGTGPQSVCSSIISSRCHGQNHVGPTLKQYSSSKKCQGKTSLVQVVVCRN
jgi:hypothetical protein